MMFRLEELTLPPGQTFAEPQSLPKNQESHFPSLEELLDDIDDLDAVSLLEYSAR